MKYLPLLIASSFAALLVACRASPEAQRTDPETIGNKMIGADDPGLAGQFLLGPDDYYVHSDKFDRAPAVVHLFADWIAETEGAVAGGDPLPLDPIAEGDFAFLNGAFQPGTTVAITWALPLPNFDVPGNAYSTIPSVQEILDGKHDDHIRDFARAIDQIELPVMLTLFGEMDNNAFYSFGPDGRHSALPDPDVPAELDVPAAQDLYGQYGDPDHPDGPERVRDALIHVIDLFEEEGVTDASWYMYGSSGFMSTTPDPGQEQLVDATREWNQPRWYYPGDDYIDWVGKSLHHSDIDNLKDKFEEAYAAWGEVTRRPFFSPEYSLRLVETSRADQIRREFRDYLTGFARFKAFAMEDQDPSTGSDEFGLSTLGGVEGQFPDELEAWRESVVENSAWKTLVYDFVP